MQMILFVGLGNPGRKYIKNRHNIGFTAIDIIADHLHAEAERSNFNAKIRKAIWQNTHDPHKTEQKQQTVLIIKPETFMNLSGQSVQAVRHFYKIPNQNIFVFHDELDLGLGKIRTKYGGGSAGHNGLRSIIQHIGADFNRIRIGIGHPGKKELVSSYVLSDFNKQEYMRVQKICFACAEHISDLIGGDLCSFQNHLAQNSAIQNL